MYYTSTPLICLHGINRDNFTLSYFLLLACYKILPEEFFLAHFVLLQTPFKSEHGNSVIENILILG